MSTKVTDYLTKQVFIDKNVVTFRSLSRQFKIHVNVAKRELATFYENTRSTKERSYATYLISGDVSYKPTDSSIGKQDSMEVDGDTQRVDQEEQEEEEEAEESEVVPQLRMTLAGEQDLEAARSSYLRIFSEHVYCLSPSPVLDVGLLCGPSDIVRAADAKLSPDESAILGRITGPHVKLGQGVKSIASTTKARIQATASIVQKSDNKPIAVKKEESIHQIDEKPVVPKLKATGKLDFSRAKVKTKSEEAGAKVKAEKSDKTVEKVESKYTKPGGKADAPPSNYFFGPKLANRKEGEGSSTRNKVKSEQPQPTEPAVKRGLKRKSTLHIDSDSEHAPPPSSRAPSSPPLTSSEDKPDYKVKGNAIVSDDDESEPQPKPKAKGRTKSVLDFDFEDVPSQSERSLRAMMDIDDDKVERVARVRTTVRESPESGDEPPDEDVVMADDSDVPQDKPKRKKKAKKIIPVGRNGLKKKRVVKSQTMMDSKGYMVTEDYSEYESVDEEEPEEQLKPKKSTKAKGAATSEAPSKAQEKVEQTKIEKEPRKILKPGGLKRAGSSGSKLAQKGSLMNFFGKK
ncbi:DNA polymerase subunit Cdc27 [Cytidiella melzeri]|nr:DNA polymerase subunit Cdc27 [Cytidiella melzeri]